MVILSNCLLNVYFHSYRFVLLLILVEKRFIAVDSNEYRDRFLFKVLRRVTDFFIICINLSPKGQGTLQKKQQEERESWRMGRMLWHAVLRMCHGYCAHSSYSCCTRLGQGQAYRKVQHGMGERLWRPQDNRGAIGSWWLLKEEEWLSFG